MNREGWRRVRLGDLVEVSHGFAFKGSDFTDEPTRDVLVTPGNFRIGGGWQDGNRKYHRAAVDPAYVLAPGDLIVSMTDLSKQGDTLGYPALVPSAPGHRFLHNQRIGRVRVKKGVDLSQRYLYYLLRTREYRNEVLATATGSTVRHTSPTRIYNFECLLPPLAEQRAIAEVLGALDDKIELNERMNATLDEMARALFKSWFVDFDPVRAKAEGRQPSHMDAATAALYPASFEDSPLGPIPAGWRVSTVGEEFEVNPRRVLRKGDEATYVDMAALPTSGPNVSAARPRAFTSGSRFEAGDTLLARITPCLENGKTAFVDFLDVGEVGWGSTEFIVLRPKAPLPAEFGYLLARNKPFREHAIQSMTGSSGRQRAPAEAVASYRMAAPGGAVAEAFGSTVRPWFALMKANTQESRTLAELRDALLPRLISGELRVGEAVEVAEVAV